MPDTDGVSIQVPIVIIIKPMFSYHVSIIPENNRNSFVCGPTFGTSILIWSSGSSKNTSPSISCSIIIIICNNNSTM